jgi:hypothetical protein
VAAALVVARTMMMLPVALAQAATTTQPIIIYQPELIL